MWGFSRTSGRLFRFFSDPDNYANPIEYEKVMTNRNRFYQARQMEKDFKEKQNNPNF